jgi:hypothetical protein
MKARKFVIVQHIFPRRTSLRGAKLRSARGAMKRRGNPDIDVCFYSVHGLPRRILPFILRYAWDKGKTLLAMTFSVGSSLNHDENSIFSYR